MRQQRSAGTRRGVVAIVALALLAAALMGCGVGKDGDKEKVSKTATTYLKALAAVDTATACRQLTRRAQGAGCAPAMDERLSRLDSHALRRAADASMDIEIHGNAATAALAEPHGARLELARLGGEWRIDSGYSVPPAASAAIPATPVGKELKWALAQLTGGAARLSAADLTAHFSEQFLAVMPARALAASLEQTAAQRGPLTFTGFAFPPTTTRAVALVDSKTGQRGSVRIQLDGGTPPRVVRFEISEAPAAVRPAGRYSGRFDIGGRRLFLHCTGSGSPTVVFQGGLASDWVPVQSKVERFTRACSYDPANGLWGRSDGAPTPRTAQDVVADLHALLAAAKVPGPYVLTGHSDGGLFVQLYASRHPDQVRGLVLIDAVNGHYYARRTAMLRRLLPPAAWKATMRALRARPPAILDPEQIDLPRSLAQTRAALSSAPLREMPLFVLSHGQPDKSASSDPKLVVADERVWRQLQAEVAALVPSSRHVIARRSGHDIQHQQPGLAVAAIHEVVRAVRDPTTWKTR